MSEKWDASSIANGILTWCNWPGFQGTHCKECDCEINTLGMSYGHVCPDCDPDGKKYTMHSFRNMGFIPHENPRFGPTLETIRNGGILAEEISESKRKFSIGQRVMVKDGSFSYNTIQTGVIVSFEKSSWPGMRWYRVDIDSGQKNKFVYESDIAPFRKFSDGEPVIIKNRNNWVHGFIVELSNEEVSYFLYGKHWYIVDTLDIKTTSSIHNSVFDGCVMESDIRQGSNPNCKCCHDTDDISVRCLFCLSVNN